MESQRTHHYGIWMATTVATLLAGVYIGALIVLSHSQEVVAAQAVELEAEARREKSMHTLSDLLRDLSEYTTKLDSFFISPDGAVSVIEDIEALSSVVSVPVTVSDVHIEDQDAKTGEGTLSMNIAAAGSWRSITHLLVLLDSLPFQSKLESVTLTFEDGGENAQWSFRGLLTVSLRR